MANEFDDLLDAELWRRSRVAVLDQKQQPKVPTSRLVARLYRAAEQPLRARLLSCLLKPLGPLGLVAVAAGAFAEFLQRNGTGNARAAMDDMARFSSEQVIELARFVEQVSPETLQEFAKLLAENPFGVAAFSASAVVLLTRRLGNQGQALALPSEERSRRPEQ